MEFKKIANALATIANTSSTLDKERYLRKYDFEIPGFKDVLAYIYDPYFTTGIGKVKLARTWEVDDVRTAEQVMHYLRLRCTGNLFDCIVANSFVYAEEDPIWQWAATGLVTKDLQIGVSVTTLNKVYGDGFIPKIGIMRGMQCPADANGIYIVTEKIDGNRRLIMNKSTGVEIYTRSGRRDYGLVEIEDQTRSLPVDYVYDCECTAVGNFSDSIELRQASASILNSRGRRTGVQALCFDMLQQEEYDKGISILGAAGRKTQLAATMGDMDSVFKLTDWFENNGFTKMAGGLKLLAARNKGEKLSLIKALPILGIARNKADGIALAQPIWETGGEGCMMVEYRSPYEVNPNPRKTLLKIKASQEFTLMCVGVFEGRNKYVGMLGGVSLNYKASDGWNYTVDCGSGFPDYLREEYWQHPEKIIGKMVEIESFGETQNAQGGYSLNCPIFKRIKGEKE